MASRKGNRKRYGSGAAALKQLEEIQKAQEAVRSAGKPDKIRSIRKSKDGFRNANRNLRTVKDFSDEYEP